MLVGVYVDDLLVTGTNISTVNKFKRQMTREFDMSDLGKLSHYLGIEVKQEKDYIELSQSAYAKRIMQKVGLLECNPAKYPMEEKIQLTKDEGGKPVNPTQLELFLVIWRGPQLYMRTLSNVSLGT